MEAAAKTFCMNHVFSYLCRPERTETSRRIIASLWPGTY